MIALNAAHKQPHTLQGDLKPGRLSHFFLAI